MKQNRIRKCLRAAALAVVALILVLAGTVFALWHNEFATLGSFRKLSDSKSFSFTFTTCDSHYGIMRFNRSNFFINN